jgi:hypothetical protein
MLTQRINKSNNESARKFYRSKAAIHGLLFSIACTVIEGAIFVLTTHHLVFAAFIWSWVFILTLRIGFLGISVQQDKVFIKQLLRTTIVSWNEIDSFTMTSGGNQKWIVQVNLKNGKRRVCLGGLSEPRGHGALDDPGPTKRKQEIEGIIMELNARLNSMKNSM